MVKQSSDADREMFKTASEDETFFQYVYHTVRTSFEEEITAESWRHGTVTAIHKKGDKNDAKNYRGLNLSSVIRTVVTKICTNRMSDWYEHQLDDKQNYRGEEKADDGEEHINGTEQFHLLKGKLIKTELQRNEYGFGLALSGHKNRNIMGTFICGLHPKGSAAQDGA